MGYLADGIREQSFEVVRHEVSSDFDTFVVPGFEGKSYMIGLTQLRVIKKNLEDGKPWYVSSPMINIDREDAAAIMNLDWNIITRD